MRARKPGGSRRLICDFCGKFVAAGCAVYNRHDSRRVAHPVCVEEAYARIPEEEDDIRTPASEARAIEEFTAEKARAMLASMPALRGLAASDIELPPRQDPAFYKGIVRAVREVVDTICATEGLGLTRRAALDFIESVCSALERLALKRYIEATEGKEAS